MVNAKIFIQQRKEAFEKFKAKREELGKIKRARKSILIQSKTGRIEQKIGIQEKRLGSRLKILREKAELRKKQQEFRRLKGEQFRGSFIGKVAVGAAKTAQAARRSKVLRGAVLSTRQKRTVQRQRHVIRSNIKSARVIKRFKKPRRRKRPQETGLVFR